MEEILAIFSQYEGLLGIILVAGLTSFILTPLSGAIAFKIGAVDKPASMRDRGDKTRHRKIHDKIMPQLGGLAVTIGMVVGIFLAYQSGLMSTIDSWQFTQILIGLAVIVMLGIWDDIVDVPAKTQFFIQIIAALIITSAGIRIDLVEILGLQLDFNVLEFTINLGERVLYFSPLADFITVIWIVGVVNAINWVDGIDGLSGTMAMVAAFTMMFIATRNSAVLAAVMAAVLGGAVFGYLPFNLPPAKTYSGSSGVMTQGFLLAILAIVSGGKLTTSIIILALPLIDAAWVLLGRYVRNRREIKGPLDLLAISDKTHLHHRLLDMGMSRRQTLFIEVTIFLIFCIAAYQLSGFSQQTVAVLVAVVACCLIFITISLLSRRAKRLNIDKTKQTTEPQRKAVVDDAPEDKYAY